MDFHELIEKVSKENVDKFLFASFLLWVFSISSMFLMASIIGFNLEANSFHEIIFASVFMISLPFLLYFSLRKGLKKYSKFFNKSSNQIDASCILVLLNVAVLDGFFIWLVCKLITNPHVNILIKILGFLLSISLVAVARHFISKKSEVITEK